MRTEANRTPCPSRRPMSQRVRTAARRSPEDYWAVRIAATREAAAGTTAADKLAVDKTAAAEARRDSYSAQSLSPRCAMRMGSKRRCLKIASECRRYIRQIRLRRASGPQNAEHDASLATRQSGTWLLTRTQLTQI